MRGFNNKKRLTKVGLFCSLYNPLPALRYSPYQGRNNPLALRALPLSGEKTNRRLFLPDRGGGPRSGGEVLTTKKEAPKDFFSYFTQL